MTTTVQVLDRARSQIGYAEYPAGSNKTKYGRWYGMDGHPWCAMFLSWVFYFEGLPQTASTSKGFAYTPAGVDWYRSQGRWHLSPEVGDLVFFDFPGGPARVSHVGVVELVRSDGSIVSIEGNTSGSGGRTGGEVWRHARRTGIVGYGRPRYGTAPPPVDDVADEEGMLLYGSS